ncbi:MAG: WecB/TagA/CpsF family glycosyltransferase [Planctomycetes bacterium]|nr:WecB/TagA/CpsF family glycosyltransferase [Planctomycetota bacterium]
MNPWSNCRTVPILGVEIAAISMDQVLNICEDVIQTHGSLQIGVINVAKIVNCQNDSDLRRSLDEADIILPDGLPIVWLSKWLGTPLHERIPGIDLMVRLLERASRRNCRIYFLGARQEVLEKVIAFVRKEYPGVRIAGYRNGYFNESQEKEIVEKIADSSADILFVGMSSPKKEVFLRKWQHAINVPVQHGVGGSFDVLAGQTKRAPLWMQKCALEWFYRLIQEPRRMWKRYLVTNSKFTVLSLQAYFRARLKT